MSREVEEEAFRFRSSGNKDVAGTVDAGDVLAELEGARGPAAWAAWLAAWRAEDLVILTDMS